MATDGSGGVAVMIDFDRDGKYVLFAEDGALLDLVHLG